MVKGWEWTDSEDSKKIIKKGKQKIEETIADVKKWE
jgi:hypothetical protein